MEVKLVVLKGRAKGKKIPLPSTQFIIGRGAECHLRAHSEQVSKIHCVIGRQHGEVAVRDLKSRNQTYINDESVQGTMRVVNGDILTVGPMQFQFEIVGKTNSVDRIREDQVLWLMDEAEDSFDVESSSETAVIEIPPELLKLYADTETPTETDADDDPDDQNLSAGKHLREYFESDTKPAAADSSARMVKLGSKQLEFIDSLLDAIRGSDEASALSRSQIVAFLINAVAAMKVDPKQIKSLQDLKAAILRGRVE